MHPLLRAVLATALLAPAVALGDELTDRGTALANDPYVADASLTTGRLAGFRRLYGEPDALAAALTPTTPALGRADLVLANDRSAWAEIVVNGVKLGVIGPYDKGTVLDVPAGTYGYTLTYPTGYVATLTATAGQVPAPTLPDLPPVPQVEPTEPTPVAPE